MTLYGVVWNDIVSNRVVVHKAIEKWKVVVRLNIMLFATPLTVVVETISWLGCRDDLIATVDYHWTTTDACHAFLVEAVFLLHRNSFY